MQKLVKFYRLLNTLSIDVAVGAVCCAAWFAILFNVILRPFALISLGLTVWIIYTVDHLLDAQKVKTPASTVRHRFHQKNFSFLLIMLVIAVITNLFFIFFIRKEVFQWGVVLSCTMIVYFLVERHLQYIKEFIISLLFSCGVLLPSLSLTSKPPDVSLMLLITQFILTAFLNLLLFSLFDHYKDNQDRRKSIVTLIGEQRTKQILIFIFACNFLLMLGATLYSPLALERTVIIFCMNTILLFVFIRSQWFGKEDRFRLVGDSIFLLPILYVLL